MGRNHAFPMVWVISLWAFCSLQACKKETDIDPGFGPNGEPRVLAFHVANIPDQNIVVDQNAKQITITVPTSFSAQFIEPTLTLTPSTSVASRDSYLLDVFSDANQYPLTLKTNNSQTNAYTVTLKPASDMLLGALSEPPTFSLTQQNVFLCIPVYNYVDGVADRTVTLLNKTTGARLQPPAYWISRQSLCDKTPRTDGAVMLSLYLNGFVKYYQPGDYTVELSKANGRTATLSQPLRFLRSAAWANFNVDYTLLLNSGDYLLYGANFYQDDKLSVRIQGRDQPAITVDALGFVNDRPGIRLPSSLSLKPGYYYIQLLVNGVATGSTGRLSVSSQAKPLLLESLTVPSQATFKNLVGEAYPFDVPITLSRGASYNIQLNSYLFTSNDKSPVVQAVFTALTDPAKVYSVPILKNNALSNTQISIPADLPAGRYQMNIQLIHDDGTTINGLPIERDIAIQ